MIKDMIYGKDEILPGKMYLYQVRELNNICFYVKQ